jgi:hypothetical protein
VRRYGRLANPTLRPTAASARRSCGCTSPTRAPPASSTVINANGYEFAFIEIELLR